MKVLITSTSGDAKELLEPLGILAQPSNYPNYYYLELENLVDLLSLSLVLEQDIIIKKDFKYQDETEDNILSILEIYNDYRE